MTKRSTVHDTFVIERTFSFKRELVYAAWTSAQAKSQWFVGPRGWEVQLRELEFRVGGRERLKGRRPDGTSSLFDARYYEIVPNELEERGEGTDLIITEQGVFLDGYDDAGRREQGTQVLIDQLEQALQRQSAGAGGRT